MCSVVKWCLNFCWNVISGLCVCGGVNGVLCGVSMVFGCVVCGFSR